MAAVRRIIVVGAGVGGAVVARRLVAAGHQVTVIAETPVTAAPTSVDLHEASTVDRVASTPVQRIVGGPLVPYPRGRGWAGSAAINAMVWDRPMDDVVPTRMVDTAEIGPVSAAVLAADPLAAPVRLSAIDGLRRTPADDLVDTVSVVAGEVSRVLIDAGSAAGVELADAQVLEADQVVLAAGALATPLILLRSGVPVWGRHLVDHPSVTIPLALRDGRGGDGAFPVVTVESRRRDGRILVVEDLGDPHHRTAGLVAALTSPTSAGTVGLDPETDAPVVAFDLLRGDDLHRLCTLVDVARALIDLPDVAALIDDIDSSMIGGADWVMHQVATTSPVYCHAASACAGTVGRHGRVRGLANVAVADASALLATPAGNPMVDVAQHAAGVAAAIAAAG